MQKLAIPKIAERGTGVSVQRRAQVVTRRETMPSLPAWAGWLSARLGSVNLPTGPVRYLTTGLPALTPSQRDYLENRIAEFEEMTLEARGDEERKVVAVTKMLLALNSAGMSSAGAEAKGEAYTFALDGVPAWAVDAAIALWIRGRVKGIDEAEFKWAPGTAVLLRIAQEQVEPYRKLMGEARALLAAKSLEEILS